MNYTITFSPSIDYIIKNTNNQFNVQGLTRMEECYYYPGGKGLNASYIMNQLGVDNVALTFTFGKTSDLFLNLLNAHGLSKNLVNLPIKSDLDIRINVKYFDSTTNFEINGPSPVITEKEFSDLKAKLKKLRKGDIVFIMGKCDETKLIELIKFVKDKGADFVIDIDSTILNDVLVYQPLVIKPNLDELSRICHQSYSDYQQIFASMSSLKQAGAKNIIVSLGGDGSLLLDDNNEFYQIKFNPLDSIKSTVGCGDTLLAAYTCNKYNKQLNTHDSIQIATALSMSTASSYFLGSAKEIEQFKPLIEIIKF